MCEATFYQVINRISRFDYYLNTMEEPQVDAGALPGSIPQQGGVQGGHISSQMVVNRHRSEVTNENSQQRQQQDAQVIRRRIEEKQDTIIIQPGGGEVSRDDPSRNNTVSHINIRQSGPSH